MDSLPPLNSLLFFETVARFKSFSKAAKERCVTPAAISYQIRILEEHLGSKLFIRGTRTIRLTEAGSLLLPQVRDALALIQHGIQQSRESLEKGSLSLSLVPSFAQHWFLARMPEFTQTYTEIDLHISASQELCNFDNTHLAIRYGNGQWPQLHVRPFLQDRMVAVCHESLLPHGHPCSTIDELLTLPLIHVRSYPWNRFLKALNHSELGSNKGPLFDDSNLLLSAATGGMGVILVRQLFVQAYLEAGTLVQAYGTTVPAEHSYFLVCPKYHLQIPKIATLIAWLETQAGEESAADHQGIGSHGE